VSQWQAGSCVLGYKVFCSLMPLAPGTRVGPYEIHSAVGEGGMGEVWLATEARLRRKVALKFLPTELTTEAWCVSRFEREARYSIPCDLTLDFRAWCGGSA